MNAGTGTFRIYRNNVTVLASNNGLSVFYRAGVGIPFVHVRAEVAALDDYGMCIDVFNDALLPGKYDGTVSALAPVDMGIEVLANGWRRAWMEWVHPTTSLLPFLYFSTSSATTTSTFAGTEYVDIWGWQIEDGDVSSYMPSVASSGTRGADVLTLALPSGTHTVTATFDDDSTQVLASGVSGSYPVDPAALNRPLVKKITAGGGAVWDFENDSYLQNGDDNLFLAYPFKLSLPDDVQTSAPRAKLSIDNVSREIAQLIRTISTPPNVLIEIVRIDDPDSVEMSLPMFRLRNVEWDALQISGDLTIDEIEKEPFPQRRYTPAEFPGLF